MSTRPNPPDDLPSDCGSRALYTLMCLERAPFDVNSLRRALPRPSAMGYSMKELRDAGRKLGVSLSGVVLKKDVRAIDRPMIVFCRRDGHGHYMAIRPVGHSRKLVQMIDPASDEPEVVDYEVAFSRPDWTGIALIPDRAGWLRPFGLEALGGLAAMALLTWFLARLWRGRTPNPPMARPWNDQPPGSVADR
ncbi:MAG: cysteine peptidase family C39 domain-containing protein [Isosphaeraceae bacterium]